MRLKVACFDTLSRHPEAIHHPASAARRPERLVFEGFEVADTPDDWLELRDVVLIPAGGAVWQDYWIAEDIEYLAADWASRSWRPGEYDPATNTIEIDPARMMPDRMIDEPALFCDSQLAATNFGHFVHDFLPYGLLFRRLRAMHPLLRPLLRPVAWESQRRLIRAVFGLPYEACRELGYITGVRHMMLARRQSYLEGAAWSTSFAGLRAARSLALRDFGIAAPEHAALAAAGDAAGLAAGLRVFLHREQDVERLTAQGLLHGRDYANIAELTALLLRHGFVVLEPGRVPIETVAALLANASVVIGVHGANIGNIVFCPPGARILELRAYYGNWPDYEMLAGVLGLDFRAIQQPRAEPPDAPLIDLAGVEAALGVAPRAARPSPEPSPVTEPEPADATAAEAVRLVIWDLDETFWRGTLSEGGITEYLDQAQEIVIELARRGIMSAICSKNDFAAARAVLEARGVWRYFVFPSIDWTAKAGRIAALVEAVQLRAASVLFIDDNALNRATAAAAVPGLQVADEQAVAGLLADRRFRGKADPGLSRLAQYKLLEQRQADARAASAAVGTEPGAGAANAAFLRGCDIRVTIETDVEAHLDRAIELVNRTNQLNFTKQRLPEDIEQARTALRAEIASLWTQAGLVRVRDRYGDYGICGFFVLHGGDAQFLGHFCFSCRILGMGVESWLYRRLGRPNLTVHGPVLVDVTQDDATGAEIDWIRLADGAAAAEDARAAGDAGTEPPAVRLRGGCDMNAMAPYFERGGVPVLLEANVAHGPHFVRMNHSSHLLAELGWPQGSFAGARRAAFDAAMAALGFAAADFATAFFTPCAPGTLLVYSAQPDAWRMAYRHREQGWRVSVTLPALAGDPLYADAAAEAAAGRQEPAAIVAALQADFVAHHIDDAELTAIYQAICRRVPAGARLVIVLATEFDVQEGAAVPWPAGAAYNAVVRAVAAEFAWVGVASLDECIAGPAERVDGVTHFHRQVYHRLYRAVMAVWAGDVREQAAEMVE